MVHTTPALAIAATALLAALPVQAGLYPKSSAVLQVDGKNYDRLIAQSNYTSVCSFSSNVQKITNICRLSNSTLLGVGIARTYNQHTRKPLNPLPVSLRLPQLTVMRIPINSSAEASVSRASLLSRLLSLAKRPGGRLWRTTMVHELQREL